VTERARGNARDKVQVFFIVGSIELAALAGFDCQGKATDVYVIYERRGMRNETSTSKKQDRQIAQQFIRDPSSLVFYPSLTHFIIVDLTYP
jgi:hypothetical protein